MSDFNIVAFRQIFPAFASETKYPDTMIKFKLSLARGYVSEGCTLQGEDYDNALMMMVAHLLWIDHLIASGQTTVSITTGATVGSVSVTSAPPPTKTGWQYWLATSPWGQQLWALLLMRAAGGWYIGGSPEGAAFRGVGGAFGRGSGRFR